MTDEVLLLKTSFVALISKLSLSTTDEKVDLLKDLLIRCISYTKKNKLDWEMKEREIKILEAEDKISFTKTKLLAVTVFSHMQYDIDMILKKLNVFEQKILMSALLELNDLPPTIAEIDSLNELSDPKLSSALIVIRWYITTYYSNIFPSLPKINLLSMGRINTTDPLDSDIVSQTVEDSIDKCIELYKEILSRKTPLNFYTPNINQAFGLISEYIDINDSNNNYLINETVELATQEISNKQFQLSRNELTIYVSRELGMYYFFGEHMELAKKYFDQIFTLKKTTKTLIYNYNFERLSKFKKIIKDSLNKTAKVKSVTKDLHSKLIELFNSPDDDYPIKELTFFDNDMDVVLNAFKEIIDSKNEQQLASISEALRYCSRFVSFPNKELLDDLIRPYNNKNNNTNVSEFNKLHLNDMSNFPIEKPLISDESDKFDDISNNNCEESLEILSNLDIPCGDIIASFPQNLVSEYFNVKMINITTLNQQLLNSLKLENINKYVTDLLSHYQNDKIKIHNHLKLLHLICNEYDEFIGAIESVLVSAMLHIVLSKYYHYANKSMNTDKQYLIQLIESLVKFVHSQSFQLDQQTYEKVVIMIEAEILTHKITYMCTLDVNFVKESASLLDQIAKHKNFELRLHVYVATYTHLINNGEYQLLIKTLNNHPIGHLSKVLGMFMLGTSMLNQADITHDSIPSTNDALGGLIELFGMFTDSSSVSSLSHISMLEFSKWIDSIINVTFIKNLLNILVSFYNNAIIDKARSNLGHVSELSELHFNLKNKNVSTVSNMVLLKLVGIVSERLLQLNYLLDVQLLHAESCYLLGDFNGCLKSFSWATVHFLKDIVGDYAENPMLDELFDQPTAIRIADCFGKTHRPIEAVCVLQPFLDDVPIEIIDANVEEIVSLMKMEHINLQLLGLIYDNGLLSTLSDSFLQRGLKDIYGKLIEIAAAPENTLCNSSFLIDRIVVAKRVRLLNHIQNTCLFTVNH